MRILIFIGSETIWPANVEHCPQSWTLGQTFLDKTASHQASFTEILSIGGEKKGLRSFSQKDLPDQGEEGVYLKRILKEDQTGASLDMPALPGIT